MRAPKIYFLSKFPVFNTVLLIIVIKLYIRSIDLITVCNYNFDQNLPIAFPIMIGKENTIIEFSKGLSSPFD